MADPKYTIVEDSHCRRFLKEEGYGFVAEIWRDLGELQVRPTNKGCDMPLPKIRTLAKRALENRNG